MGSRLSLESMRLFFFRKEKIYGIASFLKKIGEERTYSKAEQAGALEAVGTFDF